MSCVVTIVEIARAVGVSKSTVSAVMRDPEKARQASPATRQRILEAARRMGYSPNQAARSLREDSSRLVAILDACNFGSYVAEVIHGVNDVLRKHHYQLVHCIYDTPSELESQIRSLQTHRPNGWLTVGHIVQDFREVIGRLIEDGESLVQVCAADSLSGASAVYVDPGEIGRLAARHLLECGHRRILYAAGGQGKLCRAGFEEELARQHMPVETCTFLPVGSGFEAGKDIFRDWLERGKPESAVFTFDDTMASGILSEAYIQNVRIPEELSVIGVDDREFSRMLSPALTTIHLPQYDQGAAAAEMLLRRMRAPQQPPEIQTLTPELMCRASCGAPR